MNIILELHVKFQNSILEVINIIMFPLKHARERPFSW